ncbi:MAG TPA: hypothetical protein VFI61_00045 [Patescibacteria group bacterium]|nr:hypothetical protein [Patescibacteria group bacterium]
MKKLLTSLFLFITIFSFSTRLVGAQVKATGGAGVSSAGVLCGDGINTAVGCIHVLGGQSQFLGEILKWSVGVGSGIAFLLILYSGFMIMSSAGDPTRLKAGQELLTSAISGLILLVFSVFVLKFIGLDILGLGAFGFGK